MHKHRRNQNGWTDLVLLDCVAPTNQRDFQRNEREAAAHAGSWRDLIGPDAQASDRTYRRKRELATRGAKNTAAQEPLILQPAKRSPLCAASNCSAPFLMVILQRCVPLLSGGGGGLRL